MKKFVLSVLSVFMGGVAFCQVTSLHENFDVKCVLSTGFPGDWSKFNPIAATMPQGEWTCTPTNGRPNTVGTQTPGIACTGTWGSSPHTDTSYLISPALDLRSYTGNVYLQFDTKTTNLHFGAKLDVELTHNGITPDSGGLATILTPALAPLFGNADSSDWVTHQANLTPWAAVPFYIAFRYISTTSAGSIWYLDNVNTSTSRLQISDVNRDALQLEVLGNSTSNNISISCLGYAQAYYYLQLYDLMGRLVYKDYLMINDAHPVIHIDGLGLKSGLYIIKMFNDERFAAAKFMVN